MENQIAILFGAVQGVTEYLPVSSSAHLVLLPRFLGISDPGLQFDVFLHLGTLLATLGYFWKDWFNLLKNMFKGQSFALLCVATLPALIMGGLFHKWIETVLRGNFILASTLTLGGVLLYWVDLKSPRVRHLKTVGSEVLQGITFKDALWVGMFQCLALIPGMSRSGSTLIGGRLLGLDRAGAAKLSFLMSAPVTLAALVFELRKWNELAEGSVGHMGLVLGALSAFVFGALAIGGLLKLLKRFGFFSFMIYRIGLALVILWVLV